MPPGRGDGVRTGRAVALLAVSVLVAVLLLHHVGSGTVSATSAKVSHATTTVAPPVTAPTSTTVAPVPASQIKLLVLNGTGAGALAGSTSKALRAIDGYDTLAPDDTTSTVTASAIYALSTQYVAAADALATQLRLPSSAVVTPIPATAPIRANERSLADLVLVIGPGLAVPAATSTATSTTAGAATAGG